MSVPISKMEGGEGGGGVTTIMKTMLVGNIESIVVDGKEILQQ